MTIRILALPRIEAESEPTGPFTRKLTMPRLIDAGCQVYLDKRQHLIQQGLVDFDVVFLELVNEEDVDYFVGLRAQTLAPILFFAEHVSPALHASALYAGADAVVSLGDDVEVISARVLAVFRRAGLPISKPADR